MKKTVIELIDDLDGTAADQTVTFSFKGVSYEIDLNDEHLAEFSAELERWIKAARRTGGRTTTRAARSSASTSSETAKIRAWAKDNKIDVNERGRIPTAIVEQYRAATK